MNRSYPTEAGNNKRTVPIPIETKSATLHIETTGIVSFYFATTGETPTRYYDTLPVDGVANEPLHRLNPQSIMVIESTGTINKCSIEWTH